MIHFPFIVPIVMALCVGVILGIALSGRRRKAKPLDTPPVLALDKFRDKFRSDEQ